MRLLCLIFNEVTKLNTRKMFCNDDIAGGRLGTPGHLGHVLGK